MCFGGWMHCPDCPQNRDYLRRRRLPLPVHAPEYPVPLIGAKGRVKVTDFSVEVTIDQRFENKEDSPLEIEYRFPLVKGVKVTDFYAEIDGRKVVGVVKEKEQARNEYDDAIASGHGAFLLEQKAENEFAASIGNLPPKKQVLVSVTYQHELAFTEAGELSIVLPNHQLPPDGSKVPTFPVPLTADAALEARVPNGLTMEIEFEMTSAISSIECRTHEVDVKLDSDARKASVKLATSAKPLYHDMELLCKLADPSALCARVQKSANGTRVAQPLSEFIFVVDRSGSMEGTKMKNTKETMQMFLRSLSPGVLFNIVSFGSSFSMLFTQGSQEYNEETLETATKHVSGMKANMGGTEIYRTLQSIFKAPTKPGYPRQVFLLTDGEVSNVQDCIRCVKVNSDNMRMFCFGIGSGASVPLVKGMSEAGHGRYEVISDRDRIDDKVIRQLTYAMLPALTNISINWGEEKSSNSSVVSRTAPFRLPTIFNGDRVISYAWIKDNVKEESIPVRFRAATSKAEIDLTVQVELTNIPAGHAIPKLGAIALIKDLTENRSYMHDPTGNLIKGYSIESIKNELIRLSIDSGVLCEHTAFIAVDAREEATEGEMKIRKVNVVPVAPPQLAQQQQRNPDRLYKSKARSPQQQSGSFAGGSGGGSAWGSGLGGRSAPLPPGAPRGSRQLSHRSKSSLVAQPAASEQLQKSAKKERARPNAAPLSFQSSSSSSRTRAKEDYNNDSSDDDDDEFEGSVVSAAPLAPPPAPAADLDFFGDEYEAPAPAPAPAPSSSAPLLQPPAQKSSPGVIQAMKDVLLIQSASGNWLLGEVAAASKKINLVQAKEALAKLPGVTTDALTETIWGTALAIAFLEIMCALEKTTWTLVVRKAKAWLAKQPKTVDWLPEATKFVNAL